MLVLKTKRQYGKARIFALFKGRLYCKLKKKKYNELFNETLGMLIIAE